MRDHDQQAGWTGHAQAHDHDAAPGRRTLTMSLPRGADTPPPAATAAAAPDPEAAAYQRAVLDAAVRPDLHGLPEGVRGRMEHAFSADFSGVSVHQQGEAEAIGARAFARGTELHFAQGAYQPETAAGDELIGHELAHLVQQAEGRVAPTAQAKGGALNTSPALEQEADTLGARAAAGDVVRDGPRVRPGSGGVIQGYFDDAQVDEVERVRVQLRALLGDAVMISFEQQAGAGDPYKLAPWRGLLAQFQVASGQPQAIPQDPRERLMPLERSMREENRGGWNVGVYPEGTPIYKGMDPSTDKVMASDDINNSFAHTPGWFGDADVARSYAIRSTVKVAQKNLEPVPQQVDDFDPAVATIAEFEARRDVVLFSLLDKDNIQKLLVKIEGKMDRQLATPIGTFLASDAHAQRWAQGRFVDTGKPRYDRIGLLRKDAVRKRVHDIMRQLMQFARRRRIMGGREDGIDETVPMGLSMAQMTYRYEQALAKKEHPTEQDEKRALKRVRRQNVSEAEKTMTELARLAGQRFSIQLGTGMGMGWKGQKQALGDRRVDARKTNRDVYPGADTRDGYGASTPIGPAPDQFNRISLMGNDMEMLKTITEHVNVDGFWGKAVPTKWHRDAHFHPEMAVRDPAAAFQFHGRDVDPGTARGLADDQHEAHRLQTEQWRLEHQAEKAEKARLRLEQQVDDGEEFEGAPDLGEIEMEVGGNDEVGGNEDEAAEDGEEIRVD